MTVVMNSTLALVNNLNGRFRAVLCVSNLVSAIYIQLMLHGPQLGEDLPLLSMMLLLLRYVFVQSRCPGKVEAGRGPGGSHGEMQRGCRVTGHKRCKESQQNSDGVWNKCLQGGRTSV